MLKQTFRKCAVGLLLIFGFLGLLVLTAAQEPANPASRPADLIRQTVAFVDVQFTKEGKPWHSHGTGFFVFYPDKRLGGNQGFVYLITNRHVAEPDIDEGKIYPVTSRHVRLNLRHELNGKFSEDTTLPPAAPWHFPADDAVDLAAMAVLPSRDRFEYLAFPVSSFATKDVVESRAIGEGDSVLFAGYFYQFPGMEWIEPIVREGILAMMPREQMRGTLNKMAYLYLADLHVFNGNSGSPLYVNVGGARNGMLTLGGFPYLLIGVVSGYYNEDSDFKLTIATKTPKTVIGKFGANSGIALIVPVDQVKALLDSPEVQMERDKKVEELTGK